MDGKHSQLSTSMAAIRLWRQQYVRKCIGEGKSLRIVLSAFAHPLHDEIKTYYQCCLDDDDESPFTHCGQGLATRTAFSRCRTERDRISGLIMYSLVAALRQSLELLALIEGRLELPRRRFGWLEWWLTPKRLYDCRNDRRKYDAEIQLDITSAVGFFSLC